jgi:hypothetical protein
MLLHFLVAIVAELIITGSFTTVAVRQAGWAPPPAAALSRNDDGIDVDFVRPKALQENEEATKGIYRYNICNGLSHQLLQHGAAIGKAKSQCKIVAIPNYFIVNGVQHKDDNVLPNSTNSVPFDQIFDRQYCFNSRQSMRSLYRSQIWTHQQHSHC